jgi:L-threonylcarbamoyladenylate synthase
VIRISIDPREPDERAIRDAAEVLERGGVVAYPTDTLYGLAVDPRSDEAVTRLFAIKDRDRESAIALIASDAAQAEQAGAFGPAERRLAARLWPGPITIVVPRAPGMSALLSPRFDTLGVRVPAHAVATALPRAFGSCITATSANLSDRPAAITADEVAAALGDSVDLLLDGGPAPGGPPSTVVAVVGGRPVLFRAGAVAWDRVLESLE